MFLIENYISSIKSNLEKHSDLLVGNLKSVFENKFSTDIDLLDFTAFIEPTRFELSIRMFSMDKEANEVFCEADDETVFAGSIKVLPEVDYYQLKDSQLDFFFDFYEQNEDLIIPQEQKVFTNWFSECWKKAGGKALNLPSYFVFHDDYTSFELNNNRWIDDDKKWSY